MASVGQQQQILQNVLPISELSTYHPKWTIRARVTDKAPLKTFSKAGGSGGKVFHATLLDAQGGEIRASFFNEAADKHFEQLQKGKCYTLSKGRLRVANRQFNSCNHRYEISFDGPGDVEEVSDDAEIQTVKFNLVGIKSVQTKTLPCTVDFCGIITVSNPAFSFTSKEGKQLVKRELTVADDTATSIGITIWGDRASQEDVTFLGNPVVCFKGVIVKEWNEGRSGSLLEAGTMLVGQEEASKVVPEAARMAAWWVQSGQTQELTALSLVRGAGGGRAAPAGGKVVGVAEMRAAAEQVTEQAETYTVNCRLALVQTQKQGETQPLHYMACQELKEGKSFTCNRRVDSGGFCAACNRSGKVAPRLNLRCRFADFGDSCWLTTFHEPAQKVINLTGEQAQGIEQGEGGRDALESALRARYFGDLLQVTVRAKLDNFNGEPRPNITCIDARPVSKGERGRAMLQEIQEMLATA